VQSLRVGPGIAHGWPDTDQLVVPPTSIASRAEPTLTVYDVAAQKVGVSPSAVAATSVPPSAR
jgi:hypothetical protein